MKLSTGAISDGVTTVVPTAENAAEVEALLPEGWRHIVFCDRDSGQVKAARQYKGEPTRAEIERTLAESGLSIAALTIGAANDNDISSKLSIG